MKKIVLFLIVICASCSAFAQDTLKSELNPDTVFLKSDTIPLKSYASEYDPRKAVLYAAVLPGLGQVYNKKYWKLPLVYAGFIGFGYGINFYQTGYKKYKNELFDVLETGDEFSSSGYNEDQLRTIVDRYKRERDFFMILMAGMYLLQMVDAHVDAHLKEFDLNPNLQVSIQPTMNNDMMTGRTAGFSVTLRF